MNRTQRACLISFLVAGWPLMAGGEVGVLVDKQVGQSQAGYTASGDFASYDAFKPSGVGIRVGVDLLDLWAAKLGITATYRGKGEVNLVRDLAKIGKLGEEYLAVGAQFDWTLLVNLHAGAEIRAEKLTEESSVSSGYTYYTRPWVKVGAGFNLPLPVLKPFIRLEIAAPITYDKATNTVEDIRRSLAPRYQIVLYGGIRF